MLRLCAHSRNSDHRSPHPSRDANPEGDQLLWMGVEQGAEGACAAAAGFCAAISFEGVLVRGRDD